MVRVLPFMNCKNNVRNSSLVGFEQWGKLNEIKIKKSLALN